MLQPSSFQPLNKRTSPAASTATAPTAVVQPAQASSNGPASIDATLSPTSSHAQLARNGHLLPGSGPVLSSPQIHLQQQQQHHHQHHHHNHPQYNTQQQQQLPSDQIYGIKLEDGPDIIARRPSQAPSTDNHPVTAAIVVPSTAGQTSTPPVLAGLSQHSGFVEAPLGSANQNDSRSGPTSSVPVSPDTKIQQVSATIPPLQQQLSQENISFQRPGSITSDLPSNVNAGAAAATFSSATAPLATPAATATNSAAASGFTPSENVSSSHGAASAAAPMTNQVVNTTASSTPSETISTTPTTITPPPPATNPNPNPDPGKQTPGSLPSKPPHQQLQQQSGSTANPTRSSWVWNFFVQTPENPFRVQCQFKPSPDSPEICGVVLTRDKTGSTGSMCRHLSRVHQLLPSHAAASSSAASNKRGGSFAGASGSGNARGGSSSSSSSSSSNNNTNNSSSSAHTNGTASNLLGAQNSTGNGTSSNSSNVVIINGVAYNESPNGLKKLGSPLNSNNKRPLDSSSLDHSSKRANTAGSANSSGKQKSRSKSGSARGNAANSSAAAASAVAAPAPKSKFTHSYILNNILPYYIETGIVFYEPDFYRFKAHLLSTLQVPTLPSELQSFANFCLYAQSRYQSTRQSIKRELSKAPGLISLCCGVWKYEDSNATQSTRFIEKNMMLIVTARYVDANWTLRRLLLKMIPTRWYTTNVVAEIQKTALEYDISGRIFTIGIDGTQHNLDENELQVLEQSLKDTEAALTVGIFKRKASEYTSLLPRRSIYYGLDEELGELQFDCGVDRRSLVFDSLVSRVSKIVDNMIYGPLSPVIMLIMKIERVADQLVGSVALRQQMDKIVVKEVPDNSSSVMQSLSPKLSDDPQELLQLQRRAERKSLRDYDDDDDEEDYEDALKRLELDGEFNNCNKDGNDELVGWRSVYVMLKNAELNLDIIRQRSMLTEEDIDLLQALVSILKPIFTTISDLKISSYDTAGVTAFAIETMIKSVLDIHSKNASNSKALATNKQIAVLVKALEELYKERISDNILYSCIAVMDPNFKRVYWHMDSAMQLRLSETLRKGVLWVNDRSKHVGIKRLDDESISLGDDDNDIEMGDATKSGRSWSAAAGNNGGNSSSGSNAVTWNDILPSPVRELNEEGKRSKDDVTMEDLVGDVCGSSSSVTSTPTRKSESAGSAVAGAGLLSSGGAPGEPPKDEEPSFFRTLVSKEKPIDSVEVEISEYLRAHTGTKFVDPYLWWKTKGQMQFPALSKLAMTYLAIAGWNTVVHNQQLYEGSALLPCQRRRGRHQLVVKPVGAVAAAAAAAATAATTFSNTLSTSSATTTKATSALSGGSTPAETNSLATTTSTSGEKASGAVGALMKLAGSKTPEAEENGSEAKEGSAVAGSDVSEAEKATGDTEAAAVASESVPGSVPENTTGGEGSSTEAVPAAAPTASAASSVTPVATPAPAVSTPGTNPGGVTGVESAASGVGSPGASSSGLSTLATAAPVVPSMVVLEKIRPEQEMCLRYWTRYYHSP